MLTFVIFYFPLYAAVIQKNTLNVILSSREEMAEAQRTNKPSGRCHYCLMISKTCKEASKNIPARGGAPTEEYMFLNAEEEFFYEVRSSSMKIKK